MVWFDYYHLFSLRRLPLGGVVGKNVLRLGVVVLSLCI